MRHPGRLVVLLLSASCLSAEELPSPPTMEALLEEAIRAEGDVQLALLARMAVGGDPAVAALHKPEVLNLPNFQITLRAAETLSQKKTDDDYVQFVHLYRNALELQLILAGEEAVKANLYRRIFLEATPRATETALSLAQKDLDRILTLDDPLWTLVFSEETYGGARRFLIRQMTPENAVSRQALLLKCLRAATDKKQRALLAVPLLTANVRSHEVMTALFENLESVAALVAPVSSESYRLTPTIFSSRLLTDITCQPIYPGATPNVSSPEDWTRAEQTRLVAAWKTWWEKSSKADRESWQKDGLRAALSLLNARNLAERGWAIFHLRRQTGICPSFALDLSPEQDAEWVEIWAQWGKAFLSKERDAWRFDQVMRTRAALAEGSAEEKRRAVEALSFILAGTFPKEPDELRCWLAWSADRLKYQSLSDRLEIDPGLPLDVKKILTEQFKDKLEPQAILSAEEDPFDKNLVWVRMKGGFVQVLDKTGHPLKLDNDTRSEPVQVQHFENAILALTGILPEADEMVFSRGQIFVATKNGLLVYRRNAKTWMRMAVEGKSDLSDVPITEMRLKGDRLNMIVQEKPRIYDVEKQRWVVPE